MFKIYLGLAATFLFFACSTDTKKQETTTEAILTFNAIKGIKFTEVKRLFENGVAFSDIGFQQEPEWVLTFLGNDSVDVFSPMMNKMIRFRLHHDHDNYYHFGKEWFNIKLLSKDSIVLQRLEVHNYKIKNDLRSNVYMTFYADDYINKLKTDAKTLMQPSAKDTLFVKEKAELANAHPLDSNYLFSARNPVKFTSTNKILQVEKRSNEGKAYANSKSYAYLYPEYDITINKAYKDFYYAFRAVVETSGKMTVYDFPTLDEETIETRKKVLQGILDVYVQNLTKIEPGTTLGIPHASLVTFYIKGTVK